MIAARRRMGGITRAIPVLACLIVLSSVSVTAAADEATGVVHRAVLTRLDSGETRTKAWIFFRDKAIPANALDAALTNLETTYDRRAVERRHKRRTAPGLFDSRDLPVSASYTDAVTLTGAAHHISSRWLNAISAWVTRDQVAAIAALPFVQSIEPVRRGRRDPIVPTEGGSGPPAADGWYGLAQSQLEQINLVNLHDAGATGAGVVIGILDTGFKRDHVAFNHPDHPVQVIAEYDFINDDTNTGIDSGDPDNQHRHGTLILGAIGAYAPGDLIGAAFDASFILCKTEDTTDEYQGEEDNYVAGLEFIEMNGGDVSTSSLAYIDWYTQEDLDGVTAVTTIAVNAATANGMYCVTSGGNGGHDEDPEVSHLRAPADAFQVLSCGAVDSEGNIASFGSDGPTADGRVKPEILAWGVDTSTVTSDSNTDYRTASGTSLSAPLLAGAVGCIAQAQPAWTVDQLRQFLFMTALDFVENGTFDPLYIRGYGIADVFAAVALDCNSNGVPDPEDIGGGGSADVNGNGVPDECECLPDADGDGDIGFGDILAILAAWGNAGGPEDVDGDGQVGFSDVLTVLGQWGPCP